MTTRNVLATDDQMDELRIGVIRAFDKLRGRLSKEGAQDWIGASPKLDLWMEGLLPPGEAPDTPIMLKHTIVLSIPCKLPFKGAVRVSPAKSGSAELERHGDELYFDGQKIELVLSEEQKGNGVIVGHELRIEREKVGGNLSAKILDCLEEHPEMFPESWKKDEDGNTIYIYFWDDIFRGPASDDLYVRYGFRVGGRVVSRYGWLGRGWLRHDPAASVAS